jgi:FkbM family methyltransferase
VDLRAIVHRSLQRFGLDLVRYDSDRFPELARARLLAERRIDVVIDVGANDGTYVVELRERGFSGRVFSFEPVAAAYAILEQRALDDPKWECQRLALGRQPGIATINIAGNSSSSSLLPMLPRHTKAAPESAFVGTELVAVKRLDDIIGVAQEDRVWLKVDVQGFELDVLAGSERLLGQVDVVDIELSLVELYEGQPLLGEVVRDLSDRGYGLTSVQTVLRDPGNGELLQVDGLFIRRD